MSGWLFLAVLIALAAGAMRLLGLRSGMLQLGAAALMLGAAGYALQGRPGLSGRPAAPATTARNFVSLSDARHAFYGDFSPSEHWLVMADALASDGNRADAAGILRSAVREHPGDPMLWIGLGNALVDHSGVLTPPAQLAFDRAAALSPGYPAPAFFLGLAMARSGDRDGALKAWRQVLAQGPANASWRPLVEGAISALDPSAPTPTALAPVHAP